MKVLVLKLENGKNKLFNYSKMIQQVPIYLVLIVIVIIIGFYIIYMIKCHDFDNIIRTLYRQCGRWAIASIQDDSEVIRTLHANYATGYLWAIKDIASTSDFKRATGQDFLEFESKIVKIQDLSTKMLVTKCPNLVAVEDEVLLKAVYSKE